MSIVFLEDFLIFLMNKYSISSFSCFMEDATMQAVFED